LVVGAAATTLLLSFTSLFAAYELENVNSPTNTKPAHKAWLEKKFFFIVIYSFLD